MKKFQFLLILSALLCVLASCSDKKTQKSRADQIDEFRSELTSADTTEMLRLCDDAMEMLKAKQFEHVLASLYEYDDSTQQVSPLSDNMRKRYERIFKMFPVLEYNRQYFSFMLEGCNDVKYEVTFATAEQTGTNQPATTMFMFNPVKVDGEWKLCVKNADDEMDPNYQ